MRIIALALALAAAAVAEVKVLHNVTLIDGTGRKPVTGAALLIDNGRIKWVGSKDKLKAPAGAETIDLTGKYVMPGIINLHGHLGNTVDLTQDPKNFTRANLEKNLKLYASYGVTAVVSMGSDQDLVYAVRAEQRAGRPAMTRIFTAGRGFTGVAGYPTTAPGMKGVPYEVETVEQVKRAVAELADKRVDLVKIWVDDHLGKERKIPMDLSKAIIDQARQRGLRVAAHIFYYDDARNLVEAGLAALAHSVRDKPVDDAFIKTMKKANAWQAAATLTRELSVFAFAKPPEWVKDSFFTRGVSPLVVKTLNSPEYQKRANTEENMKYVGFLDTAKKNLKRLVDAGVNVGFGTDTGPPARFPGFFEHLEMQMMVDAGLTPAQIIQMATGKNAQFLGVQKDLGTLEAGKWADLVVLNNDPLADIKNTRSIQMVMVAGNRVH